MNLTDTLPEEWIPIHEAPKHIPSRPHLSTVVRWWQRGVRGRKLATQLIGGRRFTTKAAIAAFLHPEPDSSTAPQVNEADRARRAKEAGRALEAIGA